MKELKDKFISDHLYYMVLAYLHQVRYKWVYDRHLERYDYDESVPTHQRFPQFKLEWLTYDQFQELVSDATQFLLNQSEDITEETIDRYAEK
jgi:hypothetical protein